MKNRHLLSTLLTMMLCCFMSSADAQCTKTKSSCSKTKTEQTKKSCTKSYNASSCSKYKKVNCSKKNQNSNNWNTLNTIVALGGIAFDNDNQNFTTGLEYERQVGNQLGLGMLSEVVLGEENSVKIGIPINYHFRQFKISAAPMGAFHQETVLLYEDLLSSTVDAGAAVRKKEMVMEIGARVGVSYLINVNGLIIAPTARVDYLESSLVPNVGINVGFGF